MTFESNTSFGPDGEPADQSQGAPGSSTGRYSASEKDVHQLACANCGTPLSTNFGKTALICKYCGQRHKFLEPPPETMEMDFTVGDTVAVEWGGRWWSAHVVELLQGDKNEKQWKIHFEGWAPAFDDVVNSSRIRSIDYEPGESIIPPPYAKEPLAVKRNSPLPAIFGILAMAIGIALAVVWSMTQPGGIKTEPAQIEAAGMGAITGPISTNTVTPSTPIKAGQKFHVKWGDNWYLGTAMHVDPSNGEIIIRYDGWGEQYDEIVERSRLRLLK